MSCIYIRSQTRTPPLASPDPCALARPLRARSLALHRSASPCISRLARSSHMPLASPRTQHVPFPLCRTFTHSDAEFSLSLRAISSTLAHISAIPSGRWIESPDGCRGFARTSARRSQQARDGSAEIRQGEEEQASSVPVRRTTLACCPACVPPPQLCCRPHRRMLLTRPWQCHL